MMSLGSAAQTSAENNVASNYILTIPEATFLAFSARLIQKNLDQQNDIIFLSTAILMQKSFSTWTETNITDRKFSSEELDLATIVSSLWNKTKAHIENLMKDYPEAIKDERLAHSKAEVVAGDLLLKGYIGKAFTLRQANLLVETSKSIVK